MDFWQVVLYLRDLVKEGHKWQRKSVVDTASDKSFKLSTFQVLSCILAGVYVYINPTGVSDNTIDVFLSSLSIITGFFFAVIFLSYDQFCKIEKPKKDASEETKIKALKSINFLKKYNALSCYAILLALTVIFMLIGTLLFGKNINIRDGSLYWACSLADIDWRVTLVFYAIVLWRFLMIYFLLDFLIITIYAVCSLFQFLNLQMLETQFPYTINSNHVVTDFYTYKQRYGKKGVLLIVAAIVLLLLLSVLFLL